ncbi:RNase A-like domain-containing lipoprotein [Heyndrickxia sp. NPDC080065]|uniref:RNase A-like domain-containing lipoprotein n=1 Tax=Heyndrickxia sp. NPDC080065 TaxID=3390568 RepID=UPI003D0732CE
MKWIRLFLAALFTAVILMGCSLSVEKQNENSKTQQVSDTILDEMEGPPKNGHTLERHVGKSDRELEERIKRDHVTAASTYYDKETAIKAVRESLSIHDNEIKKWLDESNRDRIVLNTHHSFPVGKTVLKSDMSVHEDIHDTITVLAKDPSSQLKYKIITSYPNLKRGK